MTASFDYTKVNLYDVLGIETDASEKEIIKAYRKKALKYHPDKNPDPAAVEIFHQLSKALEVLTDDAAKKAYDKILRARAAAEIRHKQLDSKRQKLREELVAREQAGLSEAQRKAQQTKNLQAEIERLRKEGNSLLEREQALLREELAKQACLAAENKQTPTTDEPMRIKLKWKCSKSDSSNGGYDIQVITDIFTKYAKVGTVLLSSKKNGTAILEFEQSSVKLLSVEKEKGLSSCPLSVSWISGKPSERTDQVSNENVSSSTSNSDRLLTPVSSERRDDEQTQQKWTTQGLEQGVVSHTDFEDLVMMRMRQAQERKRIIQEMQQSEKSQQDYTASLTETDT